MDTQVAGNLKHLLYGQLAAFQNHVRSKEGLLPVAFILYEGNKIDIAGLAFSGNEEKRMIYDALDQRLREMKADGVMLVNEAWGVAVPEAKSAYDVVQARKAMPESLKDQPGRKEFLIATLITHGWCELHQWEIIREGKKITFGPEDILEQSADVYLISYFARGGKEKWKDKLS